MRRRVPAAASVAYSATVVGAFTNAPFTLQTLVGDGFVIAGGVALVVQRAMIVRLLFAIEYVNASAGNHAYAQSFAGSASLLRIQTRMETAGGVYGNGAARIFVASKGATITVNTSQSEGVARQVSGVLTLEEVLT